MIVTTNKKIACTPPEQNGRQMKISGGFGTPQHKDGGLMALEVVFGNKDFIAGSKVYLAEQDKQQPWASLVYELGDKKFVFVPEDRVLLVEPKE